MEYRTENLGKSYGEKQIFCHLNLCLKEGGVYCLMAPSGMGKTTLFRILMGLERADEGRLIGFEKVRFAPVFQEDRLCMGLGAVKNVRLVRPELSEETARRELLQLLPADSLNQPVSEYSGGMRRRVALMRALLSAGNFLLFDEPFEGLDEKTREAAIRVVEQKRQGRTLLFASHYPEEARALDARIIDFLSAIPERQDQSSG